MWSTIDQAMKTGFNFKRGPFEMIDQIGRRLVRR